MGVQGFTRFKKLYSEDPVVRGRVDEIGSDNREGIIKYAESELGVVFTKAEMLTDADGKVVLLEELSDDELEQVAGGKWIIPKDDE